jgi:hypothetical protein
VGALKFLTYWAGLPSHGDKELRLLWCDLTLSDAGPVPTKVSYDRDGFFGAGSNTAIYRIYGQSAMCRCSCVFAIRAGDTITGNVKNFV